MRQLLPALHHHSHPNHHLSPALSAHGGGAVTDRSSRSSRPGSPAVSRPGTPSLTPVLAAASPGINAVSSSSSSSSRSKPPVELSFRIESPPIILYGLPNESTGALLSGLFDVKINLDHPYPLDSVSLSVCQIIESRELAEKDKKRSRAAAVRSNSGIPPSTFVSTTSSSANHSHSHSHSNSDLGRTPACSQCANFTNELARWDVLSHQADLPTGSHGYPFSHLLPGSLPPTCSTPLFSVKYVLRAVAVPSDPTIPNYVLESPVKVSRAIIQGADKTSVRVFPPTALTATMVMPSVVHPRSTFTFDLTLEGVTTASKPASSTTSTTTANTAPTSSNRPAATNTAPTSSNRSATTATAPANRPATARASSAPSPLMSPSPGLRPSTSTTHETSESRPSSRTASPALAPSSPQTPPIDDPRRPRWRMRKINWRIDETIKMNPVRCKAHSQTSRVYTSMTPLVAPTDPHEETPASDPSVPAPVEGTIADASTSTRSSFENASESASAVVEQRTFSRTLDAGDIKNGWKSDFSGIGRIQLPCFEMSTHKLQDICCNVDDPVFGLSVTHTLVLELVISEEAFPHRTAKHTVPTGSARVLRMQFNLIVTDHSGLGIAWDDEVPPVYGDVPLSPPEYDRVAKLPSFEELLPMAVSLAGINSQINLNSPCSSSASSMSEQASTTSNLTS